MKNLIFVILLSIPILSQAQYKPKQFKVYGDKQVKIVLGVNLAYMTYCTIYKEQIPIETQKIANPLIFASVAGITLYKTIDYKKKKKQYLKNMYR